MLMHENKMVIQIILVAVAEQGGLTITSKKGCKD